MRITDTKLTKEAKRQLIHLSNGLSLVLFAAFVANPLATDKVLLYQMVGGIIASLSAGSFAFLLAMTIMDEEVIKT